MYGKTSFTTEEIEQLIALEAFCNEREGINIRLGLTELHKRSEVHPRDFAYEHEGQLIGYLAFFVFGQTAEIGGMVHPDHRRQGVFSALWAAASEELKRRGVQRVVFCVDRKSKTGQAFVAFAGAAYSHSEYSLPLTHDVASPTKHPNLLLREAGEADEEFVVQCSALAFGDQVEAMREVVKQTSGRPTYVAELDGVPIGAIRVFLYEERGASPHLFSVLPEHQGRGYGRQILMQTIRLLQADGRDQIDIDVECDNENALGLYLSMGFEVGSAYDFYGVRLV